MKLLSLGHIAFLLEMTRASPTGGDGEPVRILGDPWLSDHAIGDLLGRFPRLRFDPRDLGPLDAIFLSHSHTDHFDPPSLIRLWQELTPRPTLILPQSLAYLATLVREYLDGVEILFLNENAPTPFRGLTLTAFFNPETHASNEDDVMVLTVENGREIFVDESDAALPFYDPDVREILSASLGNPAMETVCFLTAKNGLDASMSMLSALTLEERRGWTARSLDETAQEIFEICTPLDDADDDLWQNERLVRLIGGQGMCFPQEVESEWNRVLFPIRLADRVGMEREIAAQLECRHTIEEFVPGQIHHLVDGRLETREDASFLTLLDREEERHFDPNLELFDDFPVAPLFDEPRDRDVQEERILRRLNERFLPYLIGCRAPPLAELLGTNHGEYRIRVRYGTTRENLDRDYRMTFERLHFEATPLRDEPDEFCWANDVEALLDGRCDEFSLFCRRPLGGKAHRFWASMGMPFLNNDLVEKKLRFHFERTARGESSRDWVMGFYGRS